MDALVFVPPIIIGFVLLLGRGRTTRLLLDAERRYGTRKLSDRAPTPERERAVNRFVIIWCLLFIGIAVGGLVQNL